MDARRFEGRKQRPTEVSLLTTNKDGEAVVMPVPLTALELKNNPFAPEVPEIELRRAGLDPSVRAWVIANECNFEAYRRTYYLEPRIEGRIHVDVHQAGSGKDDRGHQGPEGKGRQSKLTPRHLPDKRS